jgi:hypothetical protein
MNLKDQTPIAGLPGGIVMNGKKLIILAALISLLFACSGKQDPPQSPKGCMQSMPNTISGLNVTGTRTPENVTQNLWPIVCKARGLYAQQLKDNPNLKGVIEINMAVEFSGEIGAFKITRKTTDNPAFENKIKRLFQFMDFDPFGEHNSESQIMLPMHFKP